MIITVDDFCLAHLNNFKYFDEIKKQKPNFKLIAFTISNFRNKEDLLNSNIFKTWFKIHKNWVEIAVHSYDHDTIPDGDREDEELWITKALNNLKPFLPEKYGYRSPGWQTTNKTVPILRKLNFNYIAYENKFVDLTTNQIIDNNIINSHLYDLRSIEKIKEISYEIFKN